MTGGAELVTSVAPDDDFFKLLESGKPIKISGSVSKPETWNDKGAAVATRSFLKACDNAAAQRR